MTKIKENKPKAVIICRVSTKEQEETGYSLEAQELLLQEYANDPKNNIEAIKTYKISESASGKMVRKKFYEILQFIAENNVTIILCEKIDRLTRNQKDALIVDDWVHEGKNNQIHFIKENFILSQNTKAHENLVWDMKVAMARFYTNNLSEEVKKGQKQKLADGWLPTKPPLGYNTTGDKGHKTHYIDKDKAPFIREMFELYSTGNYSTPALVEVMYKKGLRNRAGKKEGKSRLYDLLIDPFYYGAIKWKDQIYPGKHEPIISKDLYDLVQSKIYRKYKIPAYQKHMPVFKSKMDCEECGGTVTWETHKGHWYGHCTHYRKECSQRLWLRQEKVEEILFPLFDNVAPRTDKVLKILEKALKESHKDEIEYHTASLNEINRRIETAQRRLEAIYEDKIDKKISPEFYDRKFTEYTKEKDSALIALRILNEGNTKYYETGFAIHELASKAVEIYKSPKTTTEDKRLLLSKIFSNLLLNADKITPQYTKPFEFLTKWVPLLNSTFEPIKNVGIKGKESTFMLSHPVWLPLYHKIRIYFKTNVNLTLDFNN